MKQGLQITGLEVALGGTVLVRLDLTVAPGEVVTVMAPSGAGKSTLLAALAGVSGPGFKVTGQVLLNGRDISGAPPQQRRMGLLFQDDLLFPHLNVAGNLAFAVPPGSSDRAGRVAAGLASVGLDGFGPRNPATLSGGQRARVALSRCLLADPEALLLDEPFSRLDMDLRGQMREMVFGHARARGLPVILVSHDPEDARAAGGRVCDTFGRPVVLPGATGV
jgi:putative thiamine transport system ATP-binding protein